MRRSLTFVEHYWELATTLSIRRQRLAHAQIRWNLAGTIPPHSRLVHLAAAGRQVARRDRVPPSYSRSCGQQTGGLLVHYGPS